MDKESKILNEHKIYYENLCMVDNQIRGNIRCHCFNKPKPLTKKLERELLNPKLVLFSHNIDSIPKYKRTKILCRNCYKDITKQIKQKEREFLTLVNYITKLEKPIEVKIAETKNKLNGLERMKKK